MNLSNLDFAKKKTIIISRSSNSNYGRNFRFASQYIFFFIRRNATLSNRTATVINRCTPKNLTKIQSSFNNTGSSKNAVLPQNASQDILAQETNGGTMGVLKINSGPEAYIIKVLSGKLGIFYPKNGNYVFYPISRSQGPYDSISLGDTTFSGEPTNQYMTSPVDYAHPSSSYKTEAHTMYANAKIPNNKVTPFPWVNEELANNTKNLAMALDNDVNFSTGFIKFLVNSIAKKIDDV